MGIRKWLTPKELRSFFFIPVKILGLGHYWKKGFEPLLTRVLTLWRNNGSTFVVQYLSEVSKVLVCWAGNEKYVPTVKSATVSVTRQGLPGIIPVILRSIILQLKTNDSIGSRIVFRAVLTVLSCYRVIGCYPKFKLDSIVSGFTGVSPTIPKEELRLFCNTLPKVLTLSGIPNLKKINESSGPNYAKATWGSPLDAIAFGYKPLVWFNFIRHCYLLGYWQVALWQSLLMFCFMPSIMVLNLFNLGPGKLILGRLVPLKEARGKVRIIAIGDWWTQCILLPLESAIFSILRSIPQDGTFSQGSPLAALIERTARTGNKLQSFDLSSATDRLPLTLQIDLLNLLGYPGDSWGNVLDREWMYKSDKDSTPIAVKYAVGQPMGLHSSWAMLALTHHAIVQVSARRAGISGWFVDYALLGDDICIAHPDVAIFYLSIMKQLGVEINMGKSHVGSVAEFAKRWVHVHYGDLSPLGAGNILLAVRNYWNCASLYKEAVERGLGDIISLARNTMEVMPLLRRKVSGQVLLASKLLVAKPEFGKDIRGPLSVRALELWLSLIFPYKVKHLIDVVYSAFRREFTAATATAYQQYNTQERRFFRHWTNFPILDGGFVSFNSRGKHIGPSWANHLLAIWDWKASWSVTIITMVRHSLSTLLLRVSPAYYAYMSIPNPHDELWLMANDLPWQRPTTVNELAEILVDMRNKEESLSVGTRPDWSDPIMEPRPKDAQIKFLKRMDFELITWYGSGPRSLVPIAPPIEVKLSARDQALLDDGWEIV